ncbi:MAG: hypothetical protein J3K34DRAFT_477798 [Monoraphidium minutum]|nr:MAG: hypothetical protein J3K34DRAFT_477798 [Monoraphidium minutum]
MNSVLQCLNCVPELGGGGGGGGGRAVVAPALAELLREMWSGGRVTVNPSRFLDAVSRHDSRWGEGYQQDCEEFLHSLLTALQSDCNRVRGKPSYRELSGKGSEAEQAEEARAYQLSWHDSIVEDTFVGQLQSTITCGACGGASHCFDPFYSLALPLPPKGGPVTVQDLLAAFVQSEELQDSERYRCDRCGPDKKQPAAKRLRVWAYPPNTLVLTLKRFAGSGGGGGGGGSFSGRFSAARKVSTPVLLQPDAALDLRPYCSARGLKECAARGALPPVYRLAAVANHSGTLGGGHYTATGRSAADGCWYDFNDSCVSRCGAPGGASGDAYALFYRLVGGGGGE